MEGLGGGGGRGKWGEMEKPLMAQILLELLRMSKKAEQFLGTSSMIPRKLSFIAGMILHKAILIISEQSWTGQAFGKYSFISSKDHRRHF